MDRGVGGDSLRAASAEPDSGLLLAPNPVAGVKTVHEIAGLVLREPSFCVLKGIAHFADIENRWIQPETKCVKNVT